MVAPVAGRTVAGDPHKIKGWRRCVGDIARPERKNEKNEPELW
jgi:hypothetical protein